MSIAQNISDDRAAHKGGAGKRVIKGASVLGIGAMVSQAIYILGLPFATYYYSPEAFGYFGSFSSLAAIFAFAGCLCYQGVFFLVDKPREERTLVAICLLAASLLSVVGALVSVGWSLISPEFGSANVFVFALLLLFAVWPRALMVGLQAATVKRGNLYNASLAQIARTITIIAVWLIPALFVDDPSLWLLIGGFMLGSWVGLGVLASKPLTGRDPDETDVERRVRPRWPEIRELARRYWQFPAFEAPAVMMRQFTQYGPILLYASLYGAAEAGFVTLATQVVIRPTTTVTQTLGDAVRKEYGERLRAGKLRGAYRFLLQAKVAFALIGVIAAIALWFVAVPLGALLLPDEWLLAAPALAATAPRLAAMILIRPTIMLASLNRRQSSILAFEIVAIVTMVASILAGWWAGLGFVDNLLLYASIFAAIGIAFVLIMVWVQGRDVRGTEEGVQ